MILKLSCMVFLSFWLKFTIATDVDLLASLIPTNFPKQNVTSYTVRYLDARSKDSKDCLTNQLLSLPENASACGSLAFALDTTRYDRYGRNVSRRIRNVIVLVVPGTYGLERGISVRSANGLIIAKHPAAKEGEVIFQCNDSETTIYNLDILYSKNVAIQGVLGTRCGPRGAALRFKLTEKITMENCIFR